jgi:hypothetical protein
VKPFEVFNKIRFDSLSNVINDLQAGIGVYSGLACTRGISCPTHASIYESKQNAEKIMIDAKTKSDLANKEQINLEKEKDIEKNDLKTFPQICDEVLNSTVVIHLTQP